MTTGLTGVLHVGGSRPQSWQHAFGTRARGATLEFGGTLSPAALRTLACDAAVVPIVLGGAAQPLDVGRATRTIPDGMRRAVTARDRGCAWPGCDRPPSWCECHHIIEWEHHGHTKIDLMLLCKHHHRLIHATDWAVRIRHGHPEFIPPRWIDPQQTPRRRPRPARRPGCARWSPRWCHHRTGT